MGGSTSRRVEGRGTSPAPLDANGRYRERGAWSLGIVGFYAFLMVVFFLFLRNEFTSSVGWAAVLLELALVFFLARYLTTRYTLDDEYLRATRLLGGQRIALRSVRRIERTSLRELAPTGFLGSWGWRGRMWSPALGTFDSIHTEPFGLLVTADPHPLFISPRDTPTFARELSRRVRSFTGPLEVDAGDPRFAAAAST